MPRPSAAASPGWAVVIPVKGAATGKSRLDLPDALRADLAIAFAQDTVRAAAATPSVGEVVVVVARDHVADFTGPGVHVVEDPGHGLVPALQRGLGGIRDRRLHRALLLGDVPALRSTELEAALAAARRIPRAMVSDGGTGTVLTTARAGVAHRPRFGAGSRTAHRRAGYVELPLRPGAGLSRDVDTLADLRAVRTLRVGPATAGALRERAVRS